MARLCNLTTILQTPLKRRRHALTLLTPPACYKFHRTAFFYIWRRTPFERPSPENPPAPGSGPGADINEASDENLRGMAS